VSYKKQELLTIREHLSSPLVKVGVRVPHFVQFIVLFYYMSLRSEFRFVMSLTISACSIRLYLYLFVAGLMSYIRNWCLFWVEWCPTHIRLCFYFVVFILCILCCQFLWIIHFELPLRYALTFI
jgi:hypothetical protein